MYVDTIRAKDIEKIGSAQEAKMIDLRSKQEYEKEHIPDSINIPYEDLDEYKSEIAEWESVIFYCDRGNLSLMAARELSKEYNGHFISVVGGFNAYRHYKNIYGDRMKTRMI